MAVCDDDSRVRWSLLKKLYNATRNVGLCPWACRWYELSKIFFMNALTKNTSIPITSLPHKNCFGNNKGVDNHPERDLTLGTCTG